MPVNRVRDAIVADPAAPRNTAIVFRRAGYAARSASAKAAGTAPDSSNLKK